MSKTVSDFAPKLAVKLETELKMKTITEFVNNTNDDNQLDSKLD